MDLSLIIIILLIITLALILIIWSHQSKPERCDTRVRKVVQVIDDTTMTTTQLPTLSIPVITPSIIEAINRGNHGWTAGYNEFFNQLTVQDLQTLLMQDIEEPVMSPHVHTTDIAVPSSFDARDKWPGLISGIKDQGVCGSCWAFATSAVLTDRLRIKTNGAFSDDLSPQFMISCRTDLEQDENKCVSNNSIIAWNFLAEIGTTVWGCYPYTSGKGIVPGCIKPYCTSITRPFKSYKIEPGSIRSLADERSIQIELMTNGPVRASMKVYRDFHSYKSGVYSHTVSDANGSHAVRIIGWGVDAKSRVPYWICANSWGTSWGSLGGYFWIRRGINECGIEDNVNAADPLIE